MDERSLGIVLFAIVAGVMLVALASLGRSAYFLVRHRWGYLRTHASTRRAALRRFMLVAGSILAFVLPVAAVVVLPRPTNLWVGAALLLAMLVVQPVCLVAAKGVRPPSPAETAAIDRTLDERWRRNAGVAVRVIPSSTDGSQPMTGYAAGLLPGLRYVMVPASVFEELSDAELDAMLAHERGHLAEYHSALRAVFAPVFIAVLVGIVLTANARPVASIALVGLLFGCLFGLAALSRWLEFRADAYAARRTDATAVIQVLETLAEHGEKTSQDPANWLDRVLLHHPPLARRRRRLDAL